MPNPLPLVLSVLNLCPVDLVLIPQVLMHVTVTRWSKPAKLAAQGCGMFLCCSRRRGHPRIANWKLDACCNAAKHFMRLYRPRRRCLSAELTPCYLAPLLANSEKYVTCIGTTTQQTSTAAREKTVTGKHLQGLRKMQKNYRKEHWSVTNTWKTKTTNIRGKILPSSSVGFWGWQS